MSDKIPTKQDVENVEYKEKNQKKEKNENKKKEEKLFRNYSSALEYILDHKELHGLTWRQLIIQDGGLYQKLYHSGTLKQAPLVKQKRKKHVSLQKQYSVDLEYFLAYAREER